MKTRLVLLGPPGSGKGTHAELLAEQFNLPTLSTGAQLRREMAAGTELGLRAHALTKDGNFVPDAMVLELASNWLRENLDGFVLDGFPRTVAQAEGLDAILRGLGRPLEAAIALDVPVEVLEARVVRRIICKRCQHTEQLEPAPADGSTGQASADDLPSCTKCGGEMQRRADDSLETLAKRLRDYDSKTRPLIPYYQGQGLLRSVDAAREVDVVFQELLTHLR